MWLKSAQHVLEALLRRKSGLGLTMSAEMVETILSPPQSAKEGSMV